MELRAALKEQYHGGFAMFAQCIERCPDDLWAAPNPPSWQSSPEDQWERPYWRIAFHNVFFTHLYLGQSEDAFEPPPLDLAVRHRADFGPLWQPPWEVEPYELPQGTEPCHQSEMLEYATYVDGIVDATVDGLDLDTENCGFPWYKNITKLSHELMNLRHLQGHVGQLSELLMLRGIDIDWKGKSMGLKR